MPAWRSEATRHVASSSGRPSPPCAPFVPATVRTSPCWGPSPTVGGSRYPPNWPQCLPPPYAKPPRATTSRCCPSDEETPLAPPAFSACPASAWTVSSQKASYPPVGCRTAPMAKYAPLTSSPSRNAQSVGTIESGNPPAAAVTSTPGRSRPSARNTSISRSTSTAPEMYRPRRYISLHSSMASTNDRDRGPRTGRPCIGIAKLVPNTSTPRRTPKPPF